VHSYKEFLVLVLPAGVEGDYENIFYYLHFKLPNINTMWKSKTKKLRTEAGSQFQNFYTKLSCFSPKIFLEIMTDTTTKLLLPSL
jgi:hypothetical protein